MLDERRLQQHRTSRAELDALRELVARDLRDAELAGLSHDRQFAIAYNAVFLLGKMVLACAGYRALAGAHHQTRFDAVPLAMGSGEKDRARYFQTCRRKRNIVDYDLASGATETEAAELLMAAYAFREDVESWITTVHPQYARSGGGRSGTR
ncbi:MAG: hypothetical protein ACT4PE_16815 [Candidatus Eiseniibacteriota bacterium]